MLSRYRGAAREAGADLVLRVTADCPLLDPAEADRVVATLEDDPAGADFATNAVPRSFPRGLDAEALFRDTLERVARLATSPAAREHVTWFLYRERPELFLTRSVRDSTDNADLRWTVDTREDLDAVRAIYHDLGLGETVRPYREVLAHVRAHPALGERNAHVRQRDE